MSKVLLTVSIFLASFILLASKGENEDPVLMQVHDRVITRSEFEVVYRKNNLDVNVADPKSVEEYLELYVDFNLKVVEAMSLGMDTNPDFLDELQGYREQLSKPYFHDPNVDEHIIEEAYERLQYDLRVSHILVSLDRNPSAADTVEAYNKAMEIRSQILSGKSFEEMAQTHSDDPTATDTPATEERPFRKGNAGDLGYFTALNMVYPFETAAYNADLGELSMPVRSDFGYHIIKVTDRLPAMGLGRVAHIMVTIPPESTNAELEAYEQKIQSIYEKVLDGEDFSTLAKEYSDDLKSAENNGEMPAFTSSRMVPEFIKAISDLDEPGQVSPPVRTNFGWHIIKLIEKQPPLSYDEIYEELKNRVSRDSRAKLSKQAVVERLKEEYKLREYPKRLKPFYSLVDESIFKAEWEVDPGANLKRRLVRFDGKSFSQSDFAEYLKETQALRAPYDIEAYVNKAFDSFVEDLLIAHEDTKLDEKYPEFRALMREYHDGILLFEITDKMVWSKAMNDTIGLQGFYEENREDYKMDERLDLTLYSFADRLQASRAMEQITTGVAQGDDYQIILQKLNQDEELTATARRLKLGRGDHAIVDRIPWRTGLHEPVRVGDEFLIVHVHQILPPQIRPMEEVRGLLISDYQDHLEKQWIKELREKYDVSINYEVLKGLSF